MRRNHAFLLLFLLLSTVIAFGWGDEGHKLINRTAANAVPADMPAFFKAGTEIIVYNGPEPDRWREKELEPSLKWSQEPDHYIDLERVSDIGQFPLSRYEFIRWAYAKRVRTLNNADDFLPEKIGFQPWITAEIYGRLKVAFRQYRILKAAGKPTAPAEHDALFYAGWLGHYVADGANPLHTTVQHNGWTGDNPNGYTTEKIHWPIESDFVNKNLAKIDPAGMVKAPSKLADPFNDYIIYLKSSFTLVEPLYQIEKRGGFNESGSDEAREFFRKQFAAGSQMLLNLWYTAWVDSEKMPEPYRPAPPKPADPAKK
ncbi:MAG TPA: hypothetical protein VN577_21585 [Terriglobales bacterium]|nr:hypothetical protein [Terriglobales bacterium]